MNCSCYGHDGGECHMSHTYWPGCACDLRGAESQQAVREQRAKQGQKVE